MIVIKYLTAILQDAMLAVDIIVTLTDFFFFFTFNFDKELF